MKQSNGHNPVIHPRVRTITIREFDKGNLVEWSVDEEGGVAHGGNELIVGQVGSDNLTDRTRRFVQESLLQAWYPYRKKARRRA